MQKHHPEKLRKLSVAEQFDIQQGKEVGLVAQKLFPTGLTVPSESIPENVHRTTDLLATHQPLFEAGFLFDHCYARVDILVPQDNGWAILEVKSSNRVKDKHLHDVSFQRFVIESQGLPVNNCFLVHLNRDYTRNGALDLDQLFIKENITEVVSPLTKTVPDKVDRLRSLLSSDTPPQELALLHDRDISSRSHNCLTDGCLELPANNVFCLRGRKQIACDLFKQGLTTIAEIPADYPLLPKQQIQRECVLSGEPFIAPDNIARFLDRLRYPLYYLDFETFATAIPLFDGLHPHAKVPFQFSLHVVEEEGSDPNHVAFLHDSSGDPREPFLQALEQVLGQTGSIIVYYKSFECNRLKELAEQFPAYQKWVTNTISRVVDLYVPFKNFWYYHPQQQGSASIKAVYAAMTDQSYTDLPIRDGRTAHVEFFRITHTDCCPEEIARVRQHLLEYCKLDTLAQVEIVQKLRDLTT
ncbi:MAG: DUF2779 domain-containing protein [Asgard group archaeon]|nr:DUF2779 domain-containing protein [Asgard group archaeon]